MGDLIPRMKDWSVEAGVDGIVYRKADGNTCRIAAEDIEYYLIRNDRDPRERDSWSTLCVSTRSDGRFDVAGAENWMDPAIVDLARKIAAGLDRPIYVMGGPEGYLLDGDPKSPVLKWRDRSRQFTVSEKAKFTLVTGFSKFGKSYPFWPIFVAIPCFAAYQFWYKHLPWQHVVMLALISLPVMCLYWAYLERDSGAKYSCKWQLQIFPDRLRLTRYETRGFKVDIRELDTSGPVGLSVDGTRILVSPPHGAEPMLILNLPAQGLEALASLLNERLNNATVSTGAS